MHALPLAGIGIAITRPLDQAKKLTQLIETAGGYVISFPLIEIAPLQDYSAFEHVIADITTYDWIIFISSNAVQNGMPRLLKQPLPSHLKFAAIGPVTARELQAFGVKQVFIPEHRFDSESLLSLPLMQDMQEKKVMVVRGVGGREVLADTLKSRGATVTFAECYHRINPQQNVDALSVAWSNQQLQAVVVTSSEAMRHLLDLATNSPWLKQVTLCVNHARIAEEPLQQGLKVLIADAPGDDAMLRLLCSLN
jgi:uroporphyrinogen-III synthase